VRESGAFRSGCSKLDCVSSLDPREPTSLRHRLPSGVTAWSSR
jgi:hypothetical protein